eukprot:UN07093
MALSFPNCFDTLCINGYSIATPPSLCHCKSVLLESRISPSILSISSRIIQTV